MPLDTIHSKILIGDELIQGSFTGLIVNSPELVDSTIYDIIFTATEVPGNTIIPDTILSFTFDTLAPNFSMLGPDSLAFINNSRVSYKISEDLASGQIEWKRISNYPFTAAMFAAAFDLPPSSNHHYQEVSALKIV